MDRISSQRGFSLVEAMIAMGVLTVGVLGAMQATIIVSNTNWGASKMSRATAIASQVRVGLEAQGREGLLAAAFFDECSTELDDHAGGLAGLAAPFTTRCIVDLDAYDEANAPIVAGYSEEDAQVFQRVVVRIRDDRDTTVELLGVVVSWRDLGRVVSHQQFVSLYDRTVISASTEL
jgi:prepilin-type N-terminal cleavage/methylation domain-containing protein